MTRVGNKLRFYSMIGLLNLMVGVMFMVVSTPRPLPPVVSAMPVALRSHPAVPKVIPAIVGTPTRIVIPSLAIDLPVGIGSYDSTSGTWNVDATKAYYADISMPINNSNGVTLIYGHAQTPVFARLPQITAGATADVYTDSGYIFHYHYQSMTQLIPTDTSVFRSDGPPTLTLQTCMGAWDAYRAMFSFSLDSVEKI